ncbi:unnamed protein product [Urochloa humidicola]
MMSARVALAGLIIMVCDSARMNPLQKDIADGWSTGTRFTNKQLMAMQKHAEMSRKLWEWKSRDYTEPHCVSELQATYLVLNTRLPGPGVGTQHQGRGLPRVQLLAVRADLLVVGTKIVIFDGKRGQIVYTHKEQGEEVMSNLYLLLTGPHTGISAACGRFTIRIDIPNADPMRLEWDSDNPEYADEVDALEPARHDIKGPDGRKAAEVIYAVMSNALEATVQVKLRLKDGHRPCGVVSGEITALIHGFPVPSIIFSSTEETDECFSPTNHDSWYLLNLSTSLVAVPCGKVLHIEVDLKIKASDNHTYLLKAPAPLKFDNNGNRSTQSHQDDGNEVQVNFTWYPEVEIGKEKSAAAAAEPSLPAETDEIATTRQSHPQTPEPTSEGIVEQEPTTAPPRQAGRRTESEWVRHSIIANFIMWRIGIAARNQQISPELTIISAWFLYSIWSSSVCIVKNTSTEAIFRQLHIDLRQRLRSMNERPQTVVVQIYQKLGFLGYRWDQSQ